MRMLRTVAVHCPRAAIALLFGAWALSGLAQDAIPGVADPAATPTQAAPSAVAAEFESPRATIDTFLLNANQAAEDTANEIALGQVYRTMDVPESVGSERANMAVKLLGFFNALGKIVGEEMAPDREGVEKDRLSRFEFFPDNPYPAARRLIRPAIFELGNEEPPARIVLARTESGEWKFSADSMATIGELWSWIERRGVRHGIDVRDISATERIRDRFVPDALKGRFILGFELWQWFGLVIGIFVAVLTDRVVRVALLPVVRWLTVRAVGGSEPAGERSIVRPIGLLVGVIVFVSLLKGLGLVGEALVVLSVSLNLVFIFAAAWTAWAVTDLLAAASLYRARGRELTIDDMVFPLLRRTAKFVILIFALIYIAHTLDVNLLPLLGSVGIAGLAISFAAQDMVRNLFGGLTVFLDRPFKTGDRVKYGGYDGFVDYIGFRSTKIKTFSGHMVTIPNGLITGEAVENVSTRTTIMCSFSLAIKLETPPEKVCEAVQLVEDILQEDGIRDAIYPTIDGDVWEPLVKFDNIKQDSFNIFVMYWHEPPSWYMQMAHAQRLNLRILEEYRNAGIELAYPTRTVHLNGELTGKHRGSGEPRAGAGEEYEPGRLAQRDEHDAGAEQGTTVGSSLLRMGDLHEPPAPIANPAADPGSQTRS